MYVYKEMLIIDNQHTDYQLITKAVNNIVGIHDDD